jgi:hypothetical protein
LTNTPEQAIGDLAIALGMWWASGCVRQVQFECFCESVAVLAKTSGVPREVARLPFTIQIGGVPRFVVEWGANGFDRGWPGKQPHG